MNWLTVIIVCVALYAVIAGYIKYRKIWEEHITFYGPLLAIKTDKVGFFDRAIKFTRFFRIYGTVGVAIVILVSFFMTLMLLIAFHQTLVSPPEPSGIYAPQNLLAIPGLNEFIPFTFAVWFAFVITLLIHEFGHAVLCRVEGIRVKCMGVLFAVIPIGAFVEPDEEDVEMTIGMPKIRMFGAGITNNIVGGLACLVVMALLLGFAAPVPVPFVQGVYKDYAADEAGIPVNSVITGVNGIAVSSINEVSEILDTSRPGDQVLLLVQKDGATSEYTLILDEWPMELGGKETGFMGIYYYDSSRVKELFGNILHPVGILLLMYVPIDTVLTGDQLMMGIIAFDSPQAVAWEVPFDGYWGIIQILFWCGWFNLAVGTFNAIPMVPLDGGYIMQEGITRFFERRNMKSVVPYIVTAISTFMLFVIVSIILIPYLFNA
jgi:membrane-associated protease RseP (regulator of RpoE activity)